MKLQEDRLLGLEEALSVLDPAPSVDAALEALRLTRVRRAAMAALKSGSLPEKEEEWHLAAEGRIFASPQAWTDWRNFLNNRSFRGKVWARLSILGPIGVASGAYGHMTYQDDPYYLGFAVGTVGFLSMIVYTNLSDSQEMQAFSPFGYIENTGGDYRDPILRDPLVPKLTPAPLSHVLTPWEAQFRQARAFNRLGEDLESLLDKEGAKLHFAAKNALSGGHPLSATARIEAVVKKNREVWAYDAAPTSSYSAKVS